MYNIYTQVLNGTTIDDDRRLLQVVDCDDNQLRRIVIPTLRKWIAASNLTYKRINSNKRLVVHIEPVKGIDADKVVRIFSARTVSLFNTHNEHIRRHNVVIRARNKKNYFEASKDMLDEASIYDINKHAVYRDEDILEHENGITLYLD